MKVADNVTMKNASSYLNNAELANDAANAVMRIALPTPGARDGLSGTLVRTALDRVLQVLTGGESDYDKENIRAYLKTMPQGEGFVPMFNGKDLTGWKGLVENPIARAKMTPQELATKQAAADAKAKTTWSVRDGTIVFNGKGDNLCSVKDYGDFEMIVDWRITKDGDSGIYLRGSPQVQIWDPARTDVGAQVGSGGLYNNQKNPSKPLVFADNPVGEWNTFRILMIGGQGHGLAQRRQGRRQRDDGELLGPEAADLPARRDRAAGARHRPGVPRHLRARAGRPDAHPDRAGEGRGVRAAVQRPQPRRLDRQPHRLHGRGRRDDVRPEGAATGRTSTRRRSTRTSRSGSSSS